LLDLLVDEEVASRHDEIATHFEMVMDDGEATASMMRKSMRVLSF
jgi:hypothetical protein